MLSGRRLRPADSEVTLSAGDRVSLLIPVPQDPRPPHADGDGRGHTAGRQAQEIARASPGWKAPLGGDAELLRADGADCGEVS